MRAFAARIGLYRVAALLVGCALVIEVCRTQVFAGNTLATIACTLGEVGGEVVVGVALLELAVAQVAPQHREHAELVRLGERLGDLVELLARLGRAPVDRRADADRAHVEALADVAEQRLVERVGVAEQLVVVDLDDERDAMCVLA